MGIMVRGDEIMKSISYILIGILIGWLTIGVVKADYLTSDIQKVINLLERIADNTAGLR